MIEDFLQNWNHYKKRRWKKILFRLVGTNETNGKNWQNNILKNENLCTSIKKVITQYGCFYQFNIKMKKKPQLQYISDQK